jgi:hypothetical protein
MPLRSHYFEMLALTVPMDSPEILCHLPFLIHLANNPVVRENC